MPAKLLPSPEVIAARIRAERERLGLNQCAAARLLGMGRENYLQLERGGANPTLATLGRLVAAGYDFRAIAPELIPARTRARTAK